MPMDMQDWSVERIVDHFDLDPHPEGGYFREVWRSDHEFDADSLTDYPGPRSAGTSILYLLPEGTVSDWHRVRSEELWLHQAGNPIELSIRSSLNDGSERHRLGRGERLQAVVPRRWWQRSESLGGPADWSLAACVVVPGFEFDDFEMLED